MVNESLRYRVVDKADNFTVIAAFIMLGDAHDYISRQSDSQNLAVYDELSGTAKQYMNETAGPFGEDLLD